MPVLGRRRPRHRVPRVVQARSRDVVHVVLPAAPGAAHRPAPIELTLPAGDRGWDLPGDAAFLAVLDVAPPGAVLDLAAGAGEHALLAAVYSTRLVRAVEADPARAHAARQTAASNALPVVVEERRLGAADAAGETVDGYVTRTALDPAVIRIGAGADAAGLVAGALGVLGHRRPWLVLKTARTAESVLARVPALVALGYRLTTDSHLARAQPGYVLAPEAVGPAYWRRFDAWSAALARASDQTAAPIAPEPPAPLAPVVDLRTADDAPAGRTHAGRTLSSPTTT